MTPRMFPVLAGAEIDLDATSTAELIRGGAARLVDGADLALLIDTVQADHGGRWPRAVVNGHNTSQ